MKLLLFLNLAKAYFVLFSIRFGGFIEGQLILNLHCALFISMSNCSYSKSLECRGKEMGVSSSIDIYRFSKHPQIAENLLLG